MTTTLASASHRRSEENGFTLIEIMVVIAVIALVARIAMSSLGALVPTTTLDSDAQRLMSKIDYLRSEAELQGKTYKIEIDIDAGRFREIWPPEMKVTIDQDPGELEEHRLDWEHLDERCKFGGVAVLGEQTIRKGRVQIVFDRNGNTADQVIFVRMKSEDLKNLIWSVQIRGLEPGSTLVRDEQDHEAILERIDEAHF